MHQDPNFNGAGLASRKILVRFIFRTLCCVQRAACITFKRMSWQAESECALQLVEQRTDLHEMFLLSRVVFLHT